MASLPPNMITGGRKPDPAFEGTERLFRAFVADELEGDKVALDAIELPDMSVNREKYGPPEWLLCLDVWKGCGVAAFQVQDVRIELTHQGVRTFHFDVIHDPTENNYPHSVVRAHEEDRHITDPAELDPELHLRWRNRLRQRLRVIIRPDE
jgi:hypothetical protein